MIYPIMYNALACVVDSCCGGGTNFSHVWICWVEKEEVREGGKERERVKGEREREGGGEREREVKGDILRKFKKQRGSRALDEWRGKMSGFVFVQLGTGFGCLPTAKLFTGNTLELLC